MADVTEVEATPIEEAIEPMGALDALVADITGEAERLAAEYRPREITTEADYRQSKRERAGANKDIKALRQRYADAMRAIKDAVAEADSRVRQALEPLGLVEAGYKAEVDAYEGRWRLERRAALAEAYADFAPDLVPLVPFEALMARYGQEKGAQWDARATSQAKAEQAMRDAVEAVAQGERAIDAMPYGEGERQALKADYFSTLDLDGAVRRLAEAREAKARVADLEEGRREKFVTYMTPEEILEESTAVGTPVHVGQSEHSKLVQHAAVTMGSPAPGEAVPPYVFAGYGTQAQADAFVDWCLRAGVKRRVKQPTHGMPYKLTTRKG